MYYGTGSLGRSPPVWGIKPLLFSHIPNMIAVNILSAKFTAFITFYKLILSDIKVKILINPKHFLMAFLDVPSLWLTPSVFSKWRGGTYREHVLAISDKPFLSFKLSNVFVPAKTAILSCSLVVFWPELPEMSILFEVLTSDDMQNDVSDMMQFLLKYKEIVQTRSKSWYFGLFREVFLLFMSYYILWVTPQHFGKWKI